MSDTTSSPPPADLHDGSARAHGPTHGFAQSMMFSAARGAALIGLAVIVGIVLLQVVDDGSKGPIGDHGSGGSAVASTTTSTTAKKGASTTTTTRAARPPGQVNVEVLNGSGQSGAAKALTQRVQTQGYQTLTPNDTGGRQGTVVYFTPGFDAEAAALATFVGNGAQAAALPSPPPDNTDPQANIVVVVGG